MTADPIPDLNATIVHAVQARIQAEVLKALSPSRPEVPQGPRTTPGRYQWGGRR